MGGTLRAWVCVLVLTVAAVISSLLLIQTCQALTASYGRPYHGHLEDGVVFPNQFPGYHLRDENRSYTTPEVVGALLDAIEAVRTQFPGTCDLFIGDFSCPGGGSAIHHRSHQNGRDVDVGMYAKGNRPLTSFAPMSEENLDAAKTWYLIENLISSQRVQYIFLDRRVQKVLYEYALTRGYDSEYLNRVFGNVPGSLIQHVRNHVDHMHVRFFTPWSTLAAHIGADEYEKQAVIDAAQQSYLPRKVSYYVTGSEKGLEELSRSFGVSLADLCAWNHISPSTVLVPGSCLVFYKRSFESESVELARSLQPGFIASANPVRLASIGPEPAPLTISDFTSSTDADRPVEKVSKPERQRASTAPFRTCKVRKGDTLEKIARRNNMDVKLLCRLNGIDKSAPLKPGRTIKTSERMYAGADKVSTNAGRRGTSSICFTSDSKKPGSPTAAYYRVNMGGTLKDVSKRTGISLSQLCQLNGLSRSDQLKPGQRIKLTQANLPVRPSLGKASCPVRDRDAAKKPAAAGHDRDKQSSKPGAAKVARKTAAKPPASKPVAGSKTKSAAKSNGAAKPATAAKGNVKPAASAGTTAAKAAAKQTGKPGKSGPATVRKKTADSRTKMKTASRPQKNTTLAGR